MAQVQVDAFRSYHRRQCFQMSVSSREARQDPGSITLTRMPQAAEDLGHFQADVAASDDQQVLRAFA